MAESPYIAHFGVPDFQTAVISILIERLGGSVEISQADLIAIAGKDLFEMEVDRDVIELCVIDPKKVKS